MISDLHGLIDDIPVAYGGAELKGKELCPMDTEKLERIIEQSEPKPVDTKIERGSPETARLYDIPFWYKAITHKWRLKRMMKKGNFDFVVIQYGYYTICYDFYKKS